MEIKTCDDHGANRTSRRRRKERNAHVRAERILPKKGVSREPDQVQIAPSRSSSFTHPRRSTLLMPGIQVLFDSAA